MSKRIEIISNDNDDAVVPPRVVIDGAVMPGVQRITWDLGDWDRGVKPEVTLVVRRPLAGNADGTTVMDVINV